MDLRLTETRERLGENELKALDDGIDAMLSVFVNAGVTPLGNDRLAHVEQIIGEFIIASRHH